MATFSLAALCLSSLVSDALAVRRYDTMGKVGLTPAQVKELAASKATLGQGLLEARDSLTDTSGDSVDTASALVDTMTETSVDADFLGFDTAISQLLMETQDVYHNFDFTQMVLHRNASLSRWASASFDVTSARLADVVTSLDGAVSNSRQLLSAALDAMALQATYETQKTAFCAQRDALAVLAQNLSSAPVDIGCDLTDPDCVTSLADFAASVATAATNLEAEVAAENAEYAQAALDCENYTNLTTEQIDKVNDAVSAYRSSFDEIQFYRRRNLFLHCRSGRWRFATCGHAARLEKVKQQAQSEDYSVYSEYHRKDKWNAVNMSWCVMDSYPQSTGTVAVANCLNKVKYSSGVGMINYYEALIEEALKGKPCNVTYTQSYVQWALPDPTADVTAALDAQFVRREDVDSQSLEESEFASRPAHNRWAFDRCKDTGNERASMRTFLEDEYGPLTDAEQIWFGRYWDWRGNATESLLKDTANMTHTALANTMPLEPVFA